MAKEIKILKSSKATEPNLNMEGLEVEYEVDGETQRLCFDDYAYWTEKEGDEERFIKKIKEISNKVPDPDKEPKSVEIKKYKGKVIQ